MDDAHVKRVRTIPLRADGDEQHSDASNDEFYDNPVDPINQLVDHLREKSEQFNASIERRQAFVSHVDRQLNEHRHSWQRWVSKKDLNNTEELNDLLHKLAYLWTSIHYLILIAGPEEAHLQQDARSVLHQLLDLENMLVSLRRIMHPHSSDVNFVINFDRYYYLQVAKDKKGLDNRLNSMVIESLVLKELECRRYAHIIFTPDGRFSDGQHNQSDKDPRIALYDRAQYVNTGISECTHYYGHVFDLRKFVYQVLSMHRIGNMSSNMNTAAEHFVTRTLRAPQILQLYSPRIMMQRIFLAFINGVYVLSQDRFITNNETLPRTDGDSCGVPYLFHDTIFNYIPDTLSAADFLICKCSGGTPCICPPRTPCTCGGVPPCRCPEPPFLRHIPTLALDALLGGQGWPLGVRLMMMAVLGRCLHQLHSLTEKLHLLPILYGVGGSGKSTLANLVDMMLSSCFTHLYNDRTYIHTPNLIQVLNNDASEDVIVVPGSATKKPHTHEIESRVEERFPLQNVLNEKLAVTATELRRDSNFPQSFLLKMAEGGQIEITNKNVKPVPFQWNLPMLICLNFNQAPHSWSDDSGEMSRRVAIFMFEKRPDAVDPDLPQKLAAELANIILKCNKIYLAWAKYAQGKDIYPAGSTAGAFQPAAYFAASRDKFIETINPFLSFWNYLLAEKMIEVAPTFTCTREEIITQYKQYLTINSNGTPPALTPQHKNRLEGFLRVNKGCRMIPTNGVGYICHGFKFVKTI